MPLWVLWVPREGSGCPRRRCGCLGEVCGCPKVETRRAVGALGCLRVLRVALWVLRAPVGAPWVGPYAALLLDLLLLDLLVVGDDLADAVDEAALVVGDEAHEDFLLGGVEQHQDPHLAGRRVREVHAARLGTRGHGVRDGDTALETGTRR